MKTTNLKFLAGLLLGATQFAHAAPDYFRWEPGSIRVYRAKNSENTFTVRVGNVGFQLNDHVHYPVTGYGKRPLRLYRDDHTGSLYHHDEDTDQDVLVTAVEKGPGWAQANYRDCDQESRVENSPAWYLGPAGWFTNALAVEYRAYGCADTGIASERYIENLGLVQRTMQTFAGPVEYDLVYASIGSVTVTEAPSSAFSISLHQGQGPRVIADLRLTAMAEQMVLQMPTSQDYDLVLRDANGREVWRWSNGKFFTPGMRKVSPKQVDYSVEVPPGDLRHPTTRRRLYLGSMADNGPGAAVRSVHQLRLHPPGNPGRKEQTMSGVYELLASGAIGLLILGANWWVLATKPPKMQPHRIKRNDSVADLRLLQAELQRWG